MACAPLVEAALQGFNATVFAYGQVGACLLGSKRCLQVLGAAFTALMLLSCSQCTSADRLRQDVYHGREGRASRAAGHHPPRL